MLDKSTPKATAGLKHAPGDIPARIATSDDHKADGEAEELVAIFRFVVPNGGCAVQNYEAEHESVDGFHDASVGPGEVASGCQGLGSAEQGGGATARCDAGNDLRGAVHRHLFPIKLVCQGEGKGHGRVEVTPRDGPCGIDHDHEHTGNGGGVPNGAPGGHTTANGENKRKGASKLSRISSVLLDRGCGPAQDEDGDAGAQDDGHRNSQADLGGRLCKVGLDLFTLGGQSLHEAELASLEKADLVRSGVEVLAQRAGSHSAAGSDAQQHRCKDLCQALHVDQKPCEVRLLHCTFSVRRHVALSRKTGQPWW